MRLGHEAPNEYVRAKCPHIACFRGKNFDGILGP